jgi:hypothetical protein
MKWWPDATLSREKIGKLLLTLVASRHTRLSFIGCSSANRLLHTTGFPVNGLQDDILIYITDFYSSTERDLMNKKCSAFLMLQKKDFPFP